MDVGGIFVAAPLPPPGEIAPYPFFVAETCQVGPASVPHQ